MKTIKLFTILVIIFLFLISSAVGAAETIEFWTINLKPNFNDYILNKIEEFEQLNNEVKIVWKDINFSSINQKLRYRIAAGNGPEVVNLSPQLMASLLKDELLFPVSLLAKDFSSDYYPKLWENGYYKGEYYAFPWYLSSKIMLYNQEIFKIAGLDPKQPPRKEENLFKIAEKITRESGVYALMPQIKIEHEFIESGIKLLQKVDGKVKAAFNNKKAEEIILKYQELLEKGIIPKDSMSSGLNIAIERYKNNDLAVLFIPVQFVEEIENESTYLKDKTKLAAVPTAEKEVVHAALMNLVIPKDAANKEKAAEFAHFITSPKAQKEFTQISAVLSSALPPKNKNRIKNKKTKFSFSEKADQILTEQLYKYQDLTFVHPKADQLLKIMEEQFARALHNKITAKEALNIMEEKWNRILSRSEKNE